MCGSILLRRDKNSLFGEPRYFAPWQGNLSRQVQEEESMAKGITIYGKASWPFTQKAREAKEKEGFTVDYQDVITDSQAMAEMLKLTQGVRQVPVLVEEGRVKIGFGGTWKVWP